MKMRTSVSFFLVCGLVLATWFLAGCDEGDGTASLRVSPASTILSGSSNTVILAVVGSVTNESSGLRALSLPIEWRVTNPALGQILESSGTIAVYVRSPENGINTVVARDQYEAEGFATIHQR